MAQPLPWKHRPGAELLRVAWPIAVSMLSHGTMTLVGTLFVARLGSDALAAVGLGGVLAFFNTCFAFGLLRAVKVAVSQAVGAGQLAGVRPLVGAGLVLAVGFGLGSTVVGWTAAPWAAAWALDGQAEALASAYLRVRSLDAVVFLAWVALSEARYGLGESRLPMVAVIAGNVVNVLATALFVGALGWGVTGAAWGTILGNGVTAAVLFGGQLREGLGLAALRWTDLGRLVALGLPLGLQFIAECGAFVLLVGLIARFGEVELAAHEVVLQLAHFAFLPTLAIGEAGSVLVGQAVGANEDSLVRRVSQRTALACLAYVALCAAAFVLFPHAIASAFTDEPELARVIVTLLLCAAALQLFNALNVVARSILRGTGDVHYPAVLNVVLAWGVTPPLAWWLGGTLGLGALGGWLGLVLEVALGAALLWWRLERGGWADAAAKSRAAVASDGPAVHPEVVPTG